VTNAKDNQLGFTNMATGKTHFVKTPHQEKLSTSVTIDSESKTVYTTGEDCIVRIWEAADTWAKVDL